MLSTGPDFLFRLKGSEWNLLSLDKEEEEVVGGALEGGGDWLKSGGVSVSDLAGSSPTGGEKTGERVNQVGLTAVRRPEEAAGAAWTTTNGDQSWHRRWTIYFLVHHF